MKADRERLAKIIGDIEKYFADLEVLDLRRQDLSEKRNFYAASMLLFSLLNRMIDLGEELVFMKKLSIPDSYKMIFTLLARGKIISQSQATKLIDLVHARNLLAHEYQDFGEEEVWEILQQVVVIKEFVDSAKNIIKSHKE
ncbi:DUF86 domain-containing protein [Candidatus Woesearchaeota archaeon]|nr:MAG: hypothetical protein QS99_C0011G0004 [archaeon GW2011_AR4]MBS3130507.1 DUF86 domain-containing protein [Candidatus Woesearchaeota archaeon]HIH37987.1 DUF86 domain-containing protein [Candidatus Woesearchaeota archaeon]HIH49105.1 DUF86 domain-containing protein [Candidatus Woesearchaeota archaeon]HIJ02956.1 DUF86 domain-containing protein [Candidatus Woesearchaeota archaeon]